MMDARRACLRPMVRTYASAGLARPLIVSRVAEAMYRQAESAGAFERRDGLLGPWLYEQDAVELVAAVLDGEDGGSSRSND
jgi:hypothetical protein